MSSPSKKSTYIELFDLIAAQKKYDEQAIRQQLQGRRFLKQLGVLKHYLYEAILESLVRFRAKDDADAQFHFLKQSAVVLMEKKMPQQALRLLKKAIRRALDEERFLIAVSLMTLRHKLSTGLYAANLAAQQTEWQQMDDCLAHFKNVQAYLRLQISATYWLRQDRQTRNPQTVEELAHIHRHPLLQDETQAHSFWARLLFHTILDAQHKANNRFDKAMQHATKALLLFDNAPNMRKTNPQNYLSVLINYSNTAYYLQDTTHLQEGIERLRNLHYKDYALENLRFCRYAVFSFSRMKISNNFANFNILWDETLAYVQSHQPEIPQHEKRLLYYNMMHNAIRLGDYNKALDARLRLAELSKTQTQSDFQRFERLLEILIHWALGNTELVLALCINASRYLREDKHDYETAFVQLFRQLAKTPDFEHKDILAQSLAQFELLFRQLPDERKALEYFDILLWIKAQMQQTSPTAYLTNNA